MKKEKVSTCQGDIQYYVPEKVNNLTMEQAREYLDSYIKDNGEKLIIDDGSKNPGVLAAEMGYDVIKAVGHGDSDSYSVILNRTKIIFCKGGSIYDN